MDIIINVLDRQVKRDDPTNIPSGGINDVRCKFVFEPGYNWDMVENKTAVFARETKWAFQINVHNDEWFYIPASILARQGIMYVSVLGTSSDGAKLIQTNTCAITIEPNGLNRNTATIFPVDEFNEFDSDAYAQYVSAVNMAANRAEDAARKLETVVLGGYTKEESDAKYQEKLFISKLITAKRCPLSIIRSGSTPSVRLFGSIPKTSPEDSKDNPGTLDGTTDFIVSYTSDYHPQLDNNVGGFSNLYRLSCKTFDYVDVTPNLVILHRWTQVLNIATTEHEWVDDNRLRVWLLRENPINTSDVTSVYTNIGDVVLDTTASYIDLAVPKDYDLTDYKVVYPLETEFQTVVNNTGLLPVEYPTYDMAVKGVIGAADPVEVTEYVLTIEVNPLSYVSEKLKKMDNVIKDLDSRVTELESRVNE